MASIPIAFGRSRRVVACSGCTSCGARGPVNTVQVTLNRRENGPMRRVLTLAAAQSYKAVTSVRRRHPYPLHMSTRQLSLRSWHSAGRAGQPNPEAISWHVRTPCFSPAFGIAWKVHSRRGASCAPRRDLDTCHNLYPAAADNVLCCHPSPCRRAAPDKLGALTAAVYRYNVYVY